MKVFRFIIALFNEGFSAVGCTLYYMIHWKGYEVNMSWPVLRQYRVAGGAEAHCAASEGSRNLERPVGYANSWTATHS